MSFFTDAVTHYARKKHKCTYCAGKIPVGVEYVVQTGAYEFEWFRNKYHNECWLALLDSEETEFTPGEGEVPFRYKGIK